MGSLAHCDDSRFRCAIVDVVQRGDVWVNIGTLLIDEVIARPCTWRLLLGLERSSVLDQIAPGSPAQSYTTHTLALEASMSAAIRARVTRIIATS